MRAPHLDEPDVAHSRRWLIFGLVAAGAWIYVVRRPSSIVSPAFWAEDGTIFFKGAIETGWRAIFEPFAGQLLLFQRGIAFLAAPLPVLIQPAIYSVSAIVAAVASTAILLSPRWRTACPPCRPVHLRHRVAEFPAGRRPLRHAQQCPLVARHRLDIARNAQRSATTCGASRGVGVHSHRELVRVRCPLRSSDVGRPRHPKSLEAFLGDRWHCDGRCPGPGHLPRRIIPPWRHRTDRRGRRQGRVGAHQASVRDRCARGPEPGGPCTTQDHGSADLGGLDPPGSDHRIPLDPRCQRSSHSHLKLPRLGCVFISGWMLALWALTLPGLNLDMAFWPAAAPRYFVVPTAAIYLLLLLWKPGGRGSFIALGVAVALLASGLLGGYPLNPRPAVDWAPFATCVDQTSQHCSIVIPPRLGS